MKTNFDLVKDYLLELGYDIVLEDSNDEIFMIEDEDSGIKKLIIGVADPIVILEQYLVEIDDSKTEIYKDLLQKNKDIVHGAFALDESGKKIIFRDTLQLENLDLNEIEASINSLRILLSEFSDELIQYSK